MCQAQSIFNSMAIEMCQGINSRCCCIWYICSQSWIDVHTVWPCVYKMHVCVSLQYKAFLLQSKENAQQYTVFLDRNWFSFSLLFAFFWVFVCYFNGIERYTFFLFVRGAGGGVVMAVIYGILTLAAWWMVADKVEIQTKSQLNWRDG